MGSAHAQSEFASGERFTEEVVVDGIPIPTAITFAPDSRIYIALKEGVVRVAKDGKLLPNPFIDLAAVVNRSTDRGLLGIAVDPRFPEKPYVYLSYVWDPPGTLADGKDQRVIRVVRYTADAAKNYNEALPDSEEVILGKNGTAQNIAGPVPAGEPSIPEPASCMTGLTMDGTPIEDCIPCDALSHTAGTLMFGADGALYASFGDSANYDRPSTLSFRAQSLDAMSGRVVRVDPDTGAGVVGNPFYDAANPRSNKSRLWAYGFRNPFRITINPNNGQVYVGDVGTSYYEEINAGKGANFGWPCYEGGFADSAQQEGPATLSQKQTGFKKDPLTIDFCTAMYARGSSKYKAPLFTYRHPYDALGKDLGSSVTGVAFYSGTAYPEKYQGALFFADYARLFIRYLTFDANGIPTAHDFAKEVGTNLGAVQLITGPDTNLYAVYLNLKTRTGQVRRFKQIDGANNPPTVRGSASPTVGSIPLVVTFSSTGSTDVDGQALDYQWNFGDGTTSTEANPVHVYTTVDTFTASLTVKEKTAPFAASTKTFTIRTGVTPPNAFIDSPSETLQFVIGETVSFSGHTNPSTGVSMSWSLLQRHNLHEHLISETTGASGSFVPEEHCDNCSYELCLSATGETGLIDQKCRSILPKTTPYTFSSVPPGASITYIDEEKEILAPYVANPIVGSRQTIRAASRSNGRSFVGWSDGQTDTARSFVTGTTPTTFRALYKNLPPRVAVKLVRPTSAASKTLRFDARASRDPEGEPIQYAWTFSDRKVLRGGVVTKTFTRSGKYGVTLVVTDRLGARSVYKGSIVVGKTSSIRKVGS
jgi:glucose/arabinose dehydrogenase/PKD repeat protein